MTRIVPVALVLALGCSSLAGVQHYRRGNQALDAGRPQRAIVEFEDAARLLPDDSPVHNHLGIAYVEAGRHEDALRAFHRAVVLDCRNEAALVNLERAEAWALANGLPLPLRPPGAPRLAAPEAVP